MSLFGHTRNWPAAPASAATTLRGEHCFTAADVSVAVQGRLTLVGAQGADAGRSDPAALVATEYRKHGRKVLERVRGSFALVVVDHRDDAVLLAIDRMGIEQIAYCGANGALAFSSSVGEVARFANRATSLKTQSLFDYLLLHVVPAPATIFEGVEKLRPGSYLWFQGGRATVDTYWRPEFFEGRADVEQLGEELRASLEGAIRAGGPGNTSGAFLSGGLDSSSVAGALGKVRGSAPSFSIGFGVDAYDESEYARIAVRHFGLTPHAYDVTPDDIVTAIPQLAAAFDEPFGNSSAVPTLFCARLAADNGVDHLFAGDGGDEIFGGNERYVKQKVFEHYYRLPAPLRRAVLEPLARAISPTNVVMPLRKFRSYVDQASIPLPERLESWNYAYRSDLAEMLEPDFRAAVSTRAPLEEMARVYASVPDASLLNKMLHYDWYYTLAYNDLRKVGWACGIAGVRVSYPMLDDRMIDLSLRIPTAMKIEGAELRSFYKRAMAGVLPAEIINKQKHGFGLPFGQWLKTHRPLADLVYGLLASLKSRGIVRPRFIDDLVEKHKTGHASFFGYPIWDLAMLEAWLGHHANGWRTTARTS